MRVCAIKVVLALWASPTLAIRLCRYLANREILHKIRKRVKGKVFSAAIIMIISEKNSMTYSCSSLSCQFSLFTVAMEEKHGNR